MHNFYVQENQSLTNLFDAIPKKMEQSLKMHEESMTSSTEWRKLKHCGTTQKDLIYRKSDNAQFVLTTDGSPLLKKKNKNKVKVEAKIKTTEHISEGAIQRPILLKDGLRGI